MFIYYNYYPQNKLTRKQLRYFIYGDPECLIRFGTILEPGVGVTGYAVMWVEGSGEKKARIFFDALIELKETIE